MIRQLLPNDFFQLQNLYKQYYKKCFMTRPDIFYDRQPITAKYFDSLLKDTPLHCVVYEENNKIVGAVVYEICENENLSILKKRSFIKITDLIIDNNCRYENAGKILYTYIQNIAHEKNLDSIQIDTWAFDKDARMLLEDIGLSVQKMSYEVILSPEYFNKTNSITIKTTEKII